MLVVRLNSLGCAMDSEFEGLDFATEMSIRKCLNWGDSKQKQEEKEIEKDLKTYMTLNWNNLLFD